MCLPRFSPISRRFWGYAIAAALVMSVVAFLIAYDSRTRWLFANTLRLAAGACAISLPVGVGLGLAVARTDIPGRRCVAALLGAMLFVPLYLQTAGWNAGFGLQGWFSLAFAGPGMPPLLRGWPGAVWVHAMSAIPWCVLIVGAGLRLLPGELEEQALLDAKPAVVFWRVTLPRVGVSVAVAGLWILVVTASEIAVTDVFRVRTFAEELYVGFALGDPLQGRGLFATRWAVLPGALLMTALVASAIAVCAYLVPRDDMSMHRPPRLFATGHWRWPLAVAVWIVVLIVVSVPLGNLIYKAGITVEQVGEARVRSWSLMKLVRIVMDSPRRFHDDFVWTLQLTNLVALFTTPVATVCAWSARSYGWRSASVWLIMAICLALPGPMIGLGLIHVLNQKGIEWLLFLYDQTLLAPCLALMLKSLPLVTAIMWYGLRSIPDEVLDAAALDGAGPVARLVLVALPQRWAVVAAGYLVAMALAMGDLAASILVVPPGVTTLSIRIFNLIHTGFEDEVAGLCLSTFALFAVMAGAAFTILLRQPD